MKNKLPFTPNKTKVCIICEGSEEFDCLKRLINIEVWNSDYQIILKNADENGNIFARYQNEFQNDNYDLILVFCDTEKKPYEQYDDIKLKINSFHKAFISNKIIIFGNPCTLQIILLHFKNIKLKSPSKSVNSSIVEELTGVKNYKGKSRQREQIFALINKRNYQTMIRRVSKLSNNDKEIGSSNFDIFAKHLEGDLLELIKEVDKKISK